MGSTLYDRILLTAGAFILALALVAGLFMCHCLSPVGFALSVLALTVAAGIVLTRFLQRYRDLDPLQPPPPDERTLRRRVRTSTITLAILLVFLLLALWKILSNPALLRSHWAEIVIPVVFILGPIQNLRRAQVNLKQFEDRRTI